MSFLLDTNICSAHFRRPAGLAHRFIQHSGGLFLSTVVLGELFSWAYSRDDPAPLLAFLNDDLLVDVGVLPFDATCAERFGMERGRLLRQGVVVPDSDLMIASVALVHDLTLVTHNTADFQNVPGLSLADWLIP
jgi:tRNA(fMet)-specific endonuclease VapC